MGATRVLTEQTHVDKGSISNSAKAMMRVAQNDLQWDRMLAPERRKQPVESGTG